MEAPFCCLEITAGSSIDRDAAEGLDYAPRRIFEQRKKAEKMANVDFSGMLLAR
jgi:hypothetical protein